MTIILLFVSAFLIRLVNLNQSLWLDEAIVAKVIRTIPLFQIPIRFSTGDFHPPLYYLFMSIWSSIFGSSEIALRMPSVIASLIAGWYVYKIASVIRDKKTGIWAAAFFLFNPLIIYYSQEARMYMAATMFLSIALYHFYLLINKTQIQNSRFKNIVLFNIFSVLALFTFYGSIFFIAGMIAAYCVIMTKRNAWGNLSEIARKIISMTGGLAMGLLFLSPLLIRQLDNAKVGLLEVKNWSLVLGKAEIKNCIMILFKFTAGRISWYPKWSYYLVGGGWSLVIGFFIFLGMKKNKVLTFLFFIPLCIGLVVSFIAPMMMYFRFLYLLPVMSVLIAISFGKKTNYAKYALSILFFMFSLVYLCIPTFHREDWKTLVQNIDIENPVYMILPSSDPVLYYNPKVSLFEIRDLEKKAVFPEHIQVVPYVEEIYGYEHTAILEKKGCRKETQAEYRGPLFLEKWKCPRLFIGHTRVSAI